MNLWIYKRKTTKCDQQLQDIYQNYISQFLGYNQSTSSMQDFLLSQIETLEYSASHQEPNLTLSYQEQKQVEIISVFGKYFHNLKQAYLKCPTSKIYQKLLSEYSLLGNSMWSHAADILQFISQVHTIQNQNKQNSYILISHFNYHSQSPLLALFCKIFGHKVNLIGSKKQMQRGWTSSTIKYSQVDKISALKSLLSSEGISTQFFQEHVQDEVEKIDENGQRLNIQIVDLFNTHPTLFKPYLIKKIQKQMKQKVLVFYIHPSQMSQISEFLNGAITKEGQSKVLYKTSINSTFPSQSCTLFQSKFEQQLISFLNEELNHPSKQDIIIFHDPTDQFVKKIKHVLKKNNSDFLKHVNIIAKPQDNTKQSLPPPPAFLGKIYSNISSGKRDSHQSSSPQKMEQPSNGSEIKGTESNISMKSANQASIKNFHAQNNIFIAPNYKSLIEWNNDLSHVFYIFDYRKDKTFHYDYDLMCYVETYQNYISPKEALLRVSCMSINKIGKYCYITSNEQDQCEGIKQDDNGQINDGKTKDIGWYCLTMIANNISSFWEEIQSSKQIKSCVSALLQAEIIKKLEKQNQKYPQYSILNEQVYKCVSRIRDLNPILCSCILKAKYGCEQQDIAPTRLALQMAIATSVMMNPECLRQSINNNNSVSNRPTQIWRQSGYLHSSIDAVIRAKIIQNRENKMNENKKSKRSVSKRLSKQTSQQYEVFGNLFQVVQADRITFDQMKIQDLLREQLINENVFNSIVDATQKICEVLDIQDYLFSSFEDINPIMVDLMKKTSKAVGVYSGSRRVGYIVKGQADGIFPSKSSLLTVLNEKPTFVYITRLAMTLSLDNSKKLEILMCNNIPQLLLIQTLGMPPSRKTNSYGQAQIQYHGIASATFKQLWRNNGADVLVFEDKFGCFVESNEQIALISIHCPKQKQTLVKNEFDLVLKKIRQKMAQQTKIMHYLGSTSLLLTTGARIIQVIKDKYINKCSLSNLDLSVEVADLQQLFEQFFVLKDITVVREPPSASYKVAYIQFQTQKDYYRFYQFYNECQYLNRYLKVSPIESVPASSSYKEQMHLEFIWNAWKSNYQAVVEYQTEEEAKKCLQSLKSTKLDGKMVKAEIRKNNTVYMEGLHNYTDEINLQLILQVFGKIKFLEILKTPLKQNLKSLQAYLQEQIKKAVPDVGQIDVKKVEKLKNGLRKCIVSYKNEAKLNQTIQALNEKIGIMGVGRIHIKSWFSFPIKIAHGYLALYEEIVSYVLSKMPDNRIKIQNTIFNEQEYIIAKSHIKQELDVFKQSINVQLQGYAVELTGFETNILLTEVGIQNLYDLQEKYSCRLLPDFGKKILTVLTLFQNVKAIKQQIKAKVQDNFFYRISLNQKSFKHFKQNPELIQKMKTQYHLSELQLEQVGRNLLLQGSANYVEKAFNYLMHLIESVSKPEDMLNEDVCGICCEQPFRPYRLQLCGHKFCLNCLLDTINATIGDISMFPIKCPQCLAQMAMIDLNELMGPESWIKANNMSLNQYVGRNAEIISNCYTAGCKQINFLIKQNFSCDQCQQSYCVKCKLNYHPGLTCEQAKQGGNAAFQKYLKEHGIRKCPNQSCKMPIERTDGCYRVTCSRCNKSMCFKCEPEKMIAYDHYNDCYKHLTDVHGGYW